MTAWIPKCAYELPGSARVGAEDKQQVLFVRGLRERALYGRPVAWSILRNQIGTGMEEGPRIRMLIKARMMGLVPGAPDMLVFVGNQVCLFEVKAEGKKPRENQNEFRQWIANVSPNVLQYTFTSAHDALEVVDVLLRRMYHDD